MHALMNAPCTGALPRVADDIANRLRAFAQSTGLLVNYTPERSLPCLKGAVLLPTANVMLAATRTHAPLMAAEAQFLADWAQLDLVLMRWDGCLGASYAVSVSLSSAVRIWQENLTFAQNGCGGILVPTHATDPSWILSSAGLRRVGGSGEPFSCTR